MRLLVLGFGMWGLGFAATQERPLPAAEPFYKRVQENLARAEQANHLYTYRERRTDIHTNPFGRLGTGGTSLFEVYPSPVRALTYRRLIAHEGVPVSAHQLSDQDREYRARAAEAHGQPQEESTRARERRRRAIDDVIASLEFTMRGREIRGGVPVIAIAFRPKKAVIPGTRQGRIAQKFTGTVWVDEAAAEVTQLEATSIEDISLGYGFVAQVGEGTTATVTRRPLADGVWMPTRMTLNGSGRAAFFIRRFELDFIVDWFDYRRLPVESLTPFVDPRIHREPGGSPQ